MRGGTARSGRAENKENPEERRREGMPQGMDWLRHWFSALTLRRTVRLNNPLRRSSHASGRSLKRFLKTYVKTPLRTLRLQASARLRQHDLIALATLFGTDKWGGSRYGPRGHWYAKRYAAHFAPLRLKRLNILEIGVGGYSDPKNGGESLRMWKAFFPHSTLYAIDIYEKRPLEERRINIFQGRQDDEAFLRKVAAEIGRLDIVIDDGSHVNAHVLKTFDVLFPLLDAHGFYVIEDTQTSYWPGFGGSSDDLTRRDTIMGHFTSLVNGLNHEELIKPGYAPSYLDRHIVAMHFYHNMIFIEKGDNREGSAAIVNNSTDAEWILRDYGRSSSYLTGKAQAPEVLIPPLRNAGS